MQPQFREVKTGLNFPELEERVLDYWRTSDAFRQSIERRKDAKPFVFLEGPPTANGRPGVHHVISRVMKDIVCRYKTMTGHRVDRKGGWDTHGLPVEIEVEKLLGLNGKKQIEEYGIQAFVEKCKEVVTNHINTGWTESTERIGYWVDTDDPYITLTNEYIESVWWVLKRFWDDDKLYQGHKVVPYCPRCGTALSSHEVAQGYAEVDDPSVYVKFRSKKDPDRYFLVWTTTPWTLPSNAALAVNPNEQYCELSVIGDEGKQETWVFANELRNKLRPDLARVISRSAPGRYLEGEEYEPLFDFEKPDKSAYRIVLADFVTIDDGTGIVHIAPAFGQDDYKVGQKHGLPLIQLVDLEGKFVPEVTPWAGVFVKDADPLITRHLKERGLLFKVESYKHDYPFCWRCDTPLLYYARASWFIRTTAYKDRMVELNKRVNWYPAHIKDRRFGDWLENNIDWAISRERYWGTPLPIWRCGDCGHTDCIGSKAELMERGRNVPHDIEFHRPYIDAVELECKCGGTMRRIPEVADAWLDSGCAHTAQWHYPFENKEAKEAAYPIDFISEAIDQTRGWFYSLLATGAFLYDDVAYRNCLCLELVLGEDGLKMSKSRGNAVDPFEVLNKHGADAIRWYFYTVAQPWQRRVFSHDAVAESLKKFLGTLYNVYGFFVLYANIEGFRPDDAPPVSERPLMDRWVLSRYNTLVEKVRVELEDYQITAAARAIEDFVDELSNWYVRRGRDRFWGSGDEADTQSAFATLHEVLTGSAKLLAPFTPFLAEEIHQNLTRSVDTNALESVHYCDFPTSDGAVIDTELESAMSLVRRVVSMGRAARNGSGIRTRQPLATMIVGGLNDAQRDALTRHRVTVLDELNVKNIAWGDDLGEFASYQIKPNLPTLGPKYGKGLNAIRSALATVDGAAMMKAFESKGSYDLTTDSGAFNLTKDDALVALESREGYAVAQEDDLFVALATALTPELAREGLARELVNRVQAMRKEADFHVADRIALSVPRGNAVYEAFEACREYVLGETLAVRVDEQPGKGAFTKDVKIDGDTLILSVERVSE